MSSVVIAGDTSGTITLAAPAVAGTTTLTLPATTGTVALTSQIVGVGIGQTWTDVTASRAAGTTYTNSTGKPIVVSIGGSQSGSYTILTITVGGVTAASWALNLASYGATVGFLTAVVPNGTTYSYTITTGYLAYWSELR